MMKFSNLFEIEFLNLFNFPVLYKAIEKGENEIIKLLLEKSNSYDICDCAIYVPFILCSFKLDILIKLIIKYFYKIFYKIQLGYDK